MQSVAILNTINLSDNIAYLKTLADNSVDTIITDSPYGLGKKQNLLKILQAWITVGYLEITGTGFMGKKWDAFVPQPVLWKECYRVLKPGGYCLSFFGTRTYHLGTTAMEIAGFEVRDQIDWIYGSGFPKSKGSLKPAHEPIAVCRKPGPLKVLNIDECRLGGAYTKKSERGGMKQAGVCYGAKKNPALVQCHPGGRYPTNIILNEDAANALDKQSGWSNSARKSPRVEKAGNSVISKHGGFGIQGGRPIGFVTHGFNDNGGASRFFYIAHPDDDDDVYPNFFYVAKASPSERAGMTHPTIKPVKLMTHLVKLFCPIGGVVVDPHGGSGPTAEACLETGRDYILIDNDPVSVAEANGRIERWHAKQNKNMAV